MRQPLCVVLNPRAGSARDVEQVEGLERSLSAFGDVEVVREEELDRCRTLVRHALDEGCSRFLAAGGDGTLNAVVNALAPDLEAVELGVLPLGTANDFCRLPRLPDTLEAAVSAVGPWRTRPFDVVRLRTEEDERYFINASVGGVATEVGKQLRHEDKHYWGALAYFATAARVIPQLRTYRLRIHVDDAASELETYGLVVANGRYVGAGVCVAGDAEPDDGQVDVVVARNVELPHLAEAVARMVAVDDRGIGEHDAMWRRRGRRVRLEADPPMQLNADGETGPTSPVEYEVLPGALRVLVTS